MLQISSLMAQLFFHSDNSKYQRMYYYYLQIQLHLTTSEKNELARSLEMVQNQLQEKESEIKREISEYKDRLLQAEKEHQDALTEANQKVNHKIGKVVL